MRSKFAQSVLNTASKRKNVYLVHTAMPKNPEFDEVSTVFTAGEARKTKNFWKRQGYVTFVEGPFKRTVNAR